jgi:putative transposase
MSQSLAKLYVHVVFSTKQRAPLLEETWREELFHVIGSSVNQVHCRTMIVGGVADHVHLLFQLGRTIALADAVGKIKSTSSMWINQSHGFQQPFHWQNGYSAFSVSQSNVEAVRNYIAHQAEHHAQQTFEDELRTWLRRYELEWNEEYVWD